MIKRDPADTTVAVLMGGWSAEREVSLSSGRGCATALRNAGFKVVPIDVERGTILDILQDLRPDVAFNALHGKWGEDGCIEWCAKFDAKKKRDDEQWTKDSLETFK